ncbi:MULTISPECIES: hypothetical protein [Paenibacillus]|uniref:hypothetical protein n=1 Tax=Paenibacillus TaxID=44249 RepID=UPI0003E1DE7F|nr:MULTISPECIES: hypothetical protein [Paenibacillus]ETT62009.1 hypothetical protein C171_11089 [Paenibacillus sp. FSL H8-237]OME52195.1 hypothetical protein BSK61_18995 [Paenibacillus odorifer]
MCSAVSLGLERSVVEMWWRCGGDVVEMWWRCGRDVVEKWWRSGGEVVEKWWSFGADVVGNCANGNGQMSGRSNV